MNVRKMEDDSFSVGSEDGILVIVIDETVKNIELFTSQLIHHVAVTRLPHLTLRDGIKRDAVTSHMAIKRLLKYAHSVINAVLQSHHS